MLSMYRIQPLPCVEAGTLDLIVLPRISNHMHIHLKVHYLFYLVHSVQFVQQPYPLAAVSCTFVSQVYKVRTWLNVFTMKSLVQLHLYIQVGRHEMMTLINFCNTDMV